MPQRLALAVVLALPLAAIACSGPAGLTAVGSVSITGSTASGPFEAAFDFPSERRLDGSGGLRAMCTISRGVGSDGGFVYGAVVDLVPSTGSPLESLTLMARSDTTTGTIEADVAGARYSSASCAYEMGYVGSDGTVNLRTAGDCTLSDGAGGSVVARSALVVRGCTVIAE